MSSAQWDQILEQTAEIKDSDQKITHLTNSFLDIPYRENSLIGSPKKNEVLVLDLAGVDCFTLLDYVESFRRSNQLSDAIDVLKQVRYRNGQVSYQQRNHFFSSWQNSNEDWIEDVTVIVGQGRAVSVSKQLNRKNNYHLWLEGIPVMAMTISYIPTAQVDPQVINTLRSGDYLGIYSEKPGLDISHTGIIIKTGGKTLLRHASSKERYRRVIDSELVDYLEEKPGIVIYRSR